MGYVRRIPAVHAWKTAPDPGQVIFVTSVTAPRMQAYSLNDMGFGAKFADPSSDSSSGQRADMTFSEDAVSNSAGGTYEWSGLGFGAKYSASVTGPGASAFRKPDDDMVAFIATGSSFGRIARPYNWYSSTGFGSALTTVTAGPSGSSNRDGVFSRAGGRFAWCINDGDDGSANRMWNTAVSGSGFGSANGTFRVSSSVFRLAFSRAGTEIGGTNNLHAWAYSEATGFGSKASNPASAASAGMFGGILWNLTDEQVILVGRSTAPQVESWVWSGGAFGAKLTSFDASLGLGTVVSGGLTESGSRLIIGRNPAGGDGDVHMIEWGVSGAGALLHSLGRDRNGVLSAGPA